MANVLSPQPAVPLTGSFAIYYTVPGSTTFTVTCIHIVNVTGAEQAVWVCIVPSAGSPAEGNALLWQFTIPARGFIEFGAGDEWEENSTLRAKVSTAAGVTLKLAGIETT